MLCKVEECGREARYKAACLCQKHYFRLRRYGTTETTKVGKGNYRIVMPGGYIRIKQPDHPLADRAGWVAEHRAVLFDDIGPGPMNCELCGVGVTWETVHVDHIDETRDNNVRSNLRPTCNACNTQRGRAPEHTYPGRTAISWDGGTMTAHEWVRELGLGISSNAVRRRLKAGQSVEQALFGRKRTHNGQSRDTHRAKLKALKAHPEPMHPSPDSGAYLGACIL